MAALPTTLILLSWIMNGGLQAEVQLHEPREALDGGDGDGLDCLREICEQAADYLVPGGFLGLEMGGEISFRIISFPGPPEICA